MSISAIDGVNKLLPANTCRLNFRGETLTTPPLKTDTLEISSKEKKQKNSMSTGMKLLLGIGGTGLAIYGALVTHRAVTKPSLEVLQKDFKEIFRRDVSLDEIPEMLKKYKEILNIKDEKEFCEKAFEQVKKDYGYGSLDLKLALDETTGGILSGGWQASGMDFRIFYKNILKHNGDVFDRQTKAGILGTFFHEFQHVKQTEYCVRTDLEKYLQAIKNENTINKEYIAGIKKFLKDDKQLAKLAAEKGMTTEQIIVQLNTELNILKTNGYTAMSEYVAEVNRQVEIIRARLNSLFGQYPKFKPDSQEYKLGEQYTKNYGNYIDAKKDSTNEEYKAQIIEKEAFNVEKLSKDIPKRLRSIWNVFSY